MIAMHKDFEIETDQGLAWIANKRDRLYAMDGIILADSDSYYFLASFIAISTAERELGCLALALTSERVMRRSHKDPLPLLAARRGERLRFDDAVTFKPLSRRMSASSKCLGRN